MNSIKQTAVLRKHQKHVDGPPRLNSSNCGAYHSSAGVSNQSTSSTQNPAGADMSQELAMKREEEFAVIEQVVMKGDLSALSPEQRVTYYRKVCESSGLNPYSNPFEYIKLNGKLTLYAKKDCTEQLRTIHGVSIEGLDARIIDDIYIVTAKARTKHGRIDQSTGAVVIGNLKGEAKANAIMKAETKAKRRVTLSICGMGWTDESEIDSIPNAKKVDVDFSSGEIKDDRVAHTAVVVPIEIKPKINEVQVCELQMILDDCDPSYKEKVFTRVKKAFNTDDLSGITSDLFEAMKSLAINNMNEYHSKQVAESQKVAEVL